MLFTCSKDSVINVWYSHNGERLGTYEGHNGSVWTVDVDCESCFFGIVLNGCDGMRRCPCLVTHTNSVVLSPIHGLSVATTSVLLAMLFHAHAHISPHSLGLIASSSLSLSLSLSSIKIPRNRISRQRAASLGSFNREMSLRLGVPHCRQARRLFRRRHQDRLHHRSTNGLRRLHPRL